MANDWLRGLVTPIVVAVIVGLVSGYMASQNALAVHGERIKSFEARADKVDVRLDRLDAKIDSFQDVKVSIARIEAELANMRAGQTRIEAELKARQ